jgi:nucleoside-diphosphate-sugar epimerase
MLTLNGRSIAVTGGSGFIGRRLIRGFLDAGASVRALLRSPDAWGPMSDRLELKRFDLGTPEAWGEALDGTDAVCHAGAFKPPNHRDSAFAAECFRTNALGTLALLESAARAGVRRLCACGKRA